MKKDKLNASFINIGSSSLLVIFLILCLVTFAILSLSSAQSDYSFSERLAKHRKEYYEASSRAEKITGEIDSILAKTAKTTPPENYEAYLQSVAEALSGTEVEGISLTWKTTDQAATIAYQIPMGDAQALQVILGVTDYREHETYYEIKAWQTVSTRTWGADDKLDLMPAVP